MRERVPLIYFHAVARGMYATAYPVFVVADDPTAPFFTVQVDDLHAVLAGAAGAHAAGEDETEPRRAYVTATFRRRLHQVAFRERVIRAHQERCALCRLRHHELLDAAHITPDREIEGDPVVGALGHDGHGATRELLRKAPERLGIVDAVERNPGDRCGERTCANSDGERHQHPDGNDDGDPGERAEDIPGPGFATGDRNLERAPRPLGAGDRGPVGHREQAAEAEHKGQDVLVRLGEDRITRVLSCDSRACPVAPPGPRRDRPAVARTPPSPELPAKPCRVEDSGPSGGGWSAQRMPGGSN